MAKAGRIFLIIGTVLLILVCGFSYFQLLQPGMGIKWVKTSPPQEPLVYLKLGENGELIGQTAEGNLYEFSVYPNHTWQKVDQPSGSPPAGKICKPGNSDNSKVNNPPGKVKSRVSETCVYVELSYHLELALLENGELWYWERADYAYTQLALVSVLSIGCIVSILIIALGLLLMILQVIKKKSA